MISYIKGKILNKQDHTLVVLSTNIGWSVNTYNADQFEIDQEVELYIHMHLREDDVSLWGFKTFDELNVFKLLLTVSGVGPRIALTLLEEKGIQDIVYSITTGNFEDLKVSGVGMKTAQKIVIELKTKMGRYMDLDKSRERLTVSNIDGTVRGEATAALITLGYKESDIIKAINSLDKELKFKSSEELIKLLLQYL